MRLGKRVSTALLSLIMVLTSLPIAPQEVYGATSGGNVIFDGFGGGGGYASGAADAGQWNENMQGIRITMTQQKKPHGKPTSTDRIETILSRGYFF